MMKSLLALTCGALLTCGLQAQVSGSINRNAPKVSNTIEMGGNKLHMQYTALRYGKGDWQKIRDNADRHERFNEFAAQSPLGRVETTCDLQVAGKEIPHGSYSMYFTVHEKAGWILNLAPKEGDPIRWRMVLSETKKKTDCLKMSLEPSGEDNSCSLSITFGAMHITVPVKIAVKKD